MCSRRLLLTFVAHFFYIFWLYIDSPSFVQSLKTLFLRPTMSGVELSLPPGFRFHPTDEELVKHYLCRKCASQTISVPIVSDVDLYKYDPWQLPGMSSYGEKEWYFFSPRDRKYPNGSRPNRAAGSGYWKATGADKPIGLPRPIGIKKALVFYVGKAPKGEKTNWIMHEYRLANVDRSARKLKSLRLDDWVLCRIYKKGGGGGGGGGNRKTVAVPGSMKAGWLRMPNLPKVEKDSTKMHTTTPTSLSYNTTPQIEPGPANPQPQQLMISDYMYLDPLEYSASTSGIFDQFSNDMRNINAIQSNQQLPTRMRGYNNGSFIENLLPPTTAAGSGEQRFSSDSANQTTTTTTMPSIFRDDKMLQDVFTFLQKPF